MSESITRTVTIVGRTITVRLRQRPAPRLDWMVDYTLPDGTRHRAACHTKDRDVAIEKLDTMVKSDQFAEQFRDATQHQESTTAGADPRLREVADYYTGVYLPNGNRAASSIAKAIQVWNDFIAHCATRKVGRFSQLTTKDLDSFSADLRHKGKAPKTIKTHLSMIRAGINVIVDVENLQGANILRWSMPIIPDPEIEPLTMNGLAKLLAVIAEYAPLIYPCVAWMAFTGNRPSDTIDLRWKHVDLDRGTVTRTQVKTKRLARYTISSGAIAVLETEMQRRNGHTDQHVFLDDTGRPFSKNRPYQLFTRALARAKYPRPVTLKDLRHTFGTLMANVPIGDPPQVCPLPILQVLMGHSDIKTTLKYVHPPDADVFIGNYGAAIAEQMPNPRHQLAP